MLPASNCLDRNGEVPTSDGQIMGGVDVQVCCSDLSTRIFKVTDGIEVALVHERDST